MKRKLEVQSKEKLPFMVNLIQCLLAQIKSPVSEENKSNFGYDERISKTGERSYKVSSRHSGVHTHYKGHGIR